MKGKTYVEHTSRNAYRFYTQGSTSVVSGVVYVRPWEMWPIKRGQNLQRLPPEAFWILGPWRQQRRSFQFPICRVPDCGTGGIIGEPPFPSIRLLLRSVLSLGVWRLENRGSNRPLE